MDDNLLLTTSNTHKRKREQHSKLSNEDTGEVVVGDRIVESISPPPSHNLGDSPISTKRVKTTASHLLSKHGIYRDSVPTAELDCISVSSAETGDHVFVTLLPKYHSTSFDDDDCDDNDGNYGGDGDEEEQEYYSNKNFLERPILEMIESVEQKAIEATMFMKKNNRMDDGNDMQEEEDQLKFETWRQSNFKGELFVDKYTPKSFTDLLTNEQFNREVLKWVKEWDPIVFPDKYSAPKTATTTTRNDGNLGPEYKIMLIAGPPGIGKTTLAHVVAKQAGYRPVEINASDDRSSDKLMHLITNYTQTQSMFGDKRPTLLIIDEIDGLHNSETSSAVSALLKLAYPPKKTDKSKKDNTKQPEDQKNQKRNQKKKSSSKKSSIRQLNRPIICICNDHYAPVLRQLRMKSKLIVFRRRETQDTYNIERLVNRISHICNIEGLDYPKRWIRELAVKSDGDIRSCLNTIQFVASGKLTNFNVTEKNSRKDYFQIMEKIFDKKKDGSALNSSSPSDQLKNVVELLNDEMDRFDTLLMGCFENYPTIKYSSSLNLKETVKVLDWTSWSDRLTQTMRKNQAFSLATYSVFPIATYHLYCSAMYKQGFHRYNYPKKDGDAYRDREQRVNICRSIFSTETKDNNNNNYSSYGTVSSSHFAHHPIRSSTDLQLDVIPQLISILFPSSLIKTKSAYTNNLMYTPDGSASLATTFKNESERAAVQKIVDLCVEYGLTFRFINDGSSSKLELDPPIHRVADFTLPSANEDKKQFFKKNANNNYNNSGNSTEQTWDLPYMVKKVVASEIHNEKLRRSSVKPKQHEKPGDDNNKNKPTSSTAKLMKSPPPVVRTPTKTTTSAFTSSPTTSPTSPVTDYSVYFSFHDGHTNAIRRPAKLRAFL